MLATLIVTLVVLSLTVSLNLVGHLALGFLDCFVLGAENLGCSVPDSGCLTLGFVLDFAESLGFVVRLLVIIVLRTLVLLVTLLIALILLVIFCP